jgi:hypothetical protein
MADAVIDAKFPKASTLATPFNNPIAEAAYGKKAR